MLWFISVKRSVDSELSDQYPVVLSVINHSILVFQFSEYHNILTEQEKKKRLLSYWNVSQIPMQSNRYKYFLLESSSTCKNCLLKLKRCVSGSCQ